MKMNNRIIASFTLFSFLSLSTPMLAAPAPSLSDKGVTVESSTGDIVHRGDAVKVGADSSMTLLLPSGTRVKVAPHSEFRISMDQKGKPELYLLTGRVMAAAQGEVSIKTYRSSAVASSGEFVLETNPQGTGLRVLSGNAKLKAHGEETVSFDRLDSLPNDIAKSSTLAFNNLAAQQTTGDFEFGAQGKGKGQGVRDAEAQETTGGVGDVAPDQDMIAPGEEAVEEVPPEPPVAETPPTTPPTTPPVEAAAATGGGGGSVLPYILGGLGIAGLILLITNDSDDDDVFVPGQVPSPSLP